MPAGPSPGAAGLAPVEEVDPHRVVQRDQVTGGLDGEVGLHRRASRRDRRAADQGRPLARRARCPVVGLQWAPWRRRIGRHAEATPRDPRRRPRRPPSPARGPPRTVRGARRPGAGGHPDALRGGPSGGRDHHRGRAVAGAAARGGPRARRDALRPLRRRPEDRVGGRRRAVPELDHDLPVAARGGLPGARSTSRTRSASRSSTSSPTTWASTTTASSSSASTEDQPARVSVTGSAPRPESASRAARSRRCHR